MGIKEFKEKIIKDEAFGKKFENVQTPEDVVELAKKEGFNFTVEDIANDTELSDAELEAVAGGVSILAKTYFVSPTTIFAKTFFVKK